MRIILSVPFCRLGNRPTGNEPLSSERKPQGGFLGVIPAFLENQQVYRSGEATGPLTPHSQACESTSKPAESAGPVCDPSLEFARTEWWRMNGCPTIFILAGLDPKASTDIIFNRATIKTRVDKEQGKTPATNGCRPPSQFLACFWVDQFDYAST